MILGGYNFAITARNPTQVKLQGIEPVCSNGTTYDTLKISNSQGSGLVFGTWQSMGHYTVGSRYEKRRVT